MKDGGSLNGCSSTHVTRADYERSIIKRFREKKNTRKRVFVISRDSWHRRLVLT